MTDFLAYFAPGTEPLDFEPVLPLFTALPPSAIEPLPEGATVTAAQAAKVAGCSEVWLSKLRQSNQGPPFERIDGRVYYDRAALMAWSDAR